MSFAAEPFAQFVDDLLTGLTGGIVRRSFRFLPEEAPFRLDAPGAILPDTVRVHGLVDGAYRRFRRDLDFRLGAQSTLEWLAQADGSPAANATWPDEGTVFYASYEHQGRFDPFRVPTDRNPGSVTRLLAESFAREYAVLSGQLEAVYKAAFVDTATGRDLDQVAALVGIERRGATAATGSVVFSRRSPSPADIFIPEGARLSTAVAPPAVFETTAEATLRRGELSVEAPIAALVSDARGVVAASAISVLNRPILGIETVENPQPTRFAGSRESDEALRARVRRALEAASGATPGALLGALAGVEGLREKDVLISEDPIARPGVVEINVALPELGGEAREAAIINAHAAIEATRPLGVRVLTNVAAPGVLGAAEPGGNPQDDPGDDPAVIVPTADEGGELFAPVDVEVTLAPTRLGLTAREREDLRRLAETTVRDFIAEAGIGETLVYNRLIGTLMAIEGVLDVAVTMRPQDAPGDGPRRKNLIPASPKARPTPGLISVEVGGALVVLDVTANVVITGAGLLDDPQTARETARDAIEDSLREGLQTFAGASLTTGALNQMLLKSDTYQVRNLHYKVEYQDAGVRVHQQDVELPLSGLEQIWVRRVELASGTA